MDTDKPDLDRLAQLMADPQKRAENYRELIPAYYQFATPIYRDLWGDSFHTTTFAGEETTAEAAAAQERWLADQGGFGPGQHILDLGCGVGDPALTISAYSGAKVTGITISPLQVSIAQAKTRDIDATDRVTFVEGDFMDMPFDDASFDAAYVFEATCHMPDKAAGFREIARVIKPGGVFLGFDWFCRDAMTDSKYAEHIEPLCATWAIPNLITLPHLRHCLTNAGFDDPHIVNAGELGSFERTWDFVNSEAIPTLSASNDPNLAGLMAESVRRLSRAHRDGYFLIGYWRCTKSADRHNHATSSGSNHE